MAKTQAQLSLGISSHNNHYLFSDHYLNTLLKTDPRWTAVLAEADEFMTWVTAVYHQESPQFPNYSESQLEDHWFKPIFDKLGHVYEGQAKIPGLTSGVKYPDFVFFPDETTRQQAVGQQQTHAYVQDALAVGEVKKWDIPLGKKSKGAPSFDNNNPSYQIDYYLRATDLDWGILSNGRLWRLVHKETSYKLDIYFQIDLEQAILDQNRAAFIFFVRFFRQGAFLPDDKGRIFLDDALRASAAYTLQLEADLRDNAYKALEHLIQGFIEPQANQLSAADLPAIYTNSLYLLYRIIFLFYGESRGLLPIENPDYQKYSLTQFARDIAKDLDSGVQAAPMTSGYWHKLKQLFTIINGDQPDLNHHLGVPRYNGGLFNPALHPFLEQHFVGDKYLAAAIDVLARRLVGDKKADLRAENVDYRTLGVRQLGSIYEGLLEYQPQQAAEPMVAIKKGKGEEWLPAARKPKRAKIVDTRGVGDIYLVTDKGERKATGSYYTPDYIVKYIVEQTLEPLVENIRHPSPRHLHNADNPKSPRHLHDADNSITISAGDLGLPTTFAAQILSLNVLDPAMGSGHFLVEATDYLARALATDGAQTSTSEVSTPDNPIPTSEVSNPDNPIPTSEVLNKDKSPTAELSTEVPDTFAEDDLVYWRRQVVEACIYGVDKNPMAVELAKLSLWLVTVAKDKPLSFLDHHLRHGDSLVGAQLKDLNSLPTTKKPRRSLKTSEVSADEGTPAQPMLINETALAQDTFKAVGGMMAIEGMLSDTIDDIHAKEELLHQLDAHLEKWRRIADLWTSSFFGNSMSPEEYADLLRYLQDSASQVPGTSEVPGTSSLMIAAQREQFLSHPALVDNDYFHWQFAFPELYFDKHGQPLGDAAGFDAVIGNPPYVRQEFMSDYKPFLSSSFKDVYDGKADIYIYFYEQAVNLLRESGLTSYIVTNKWLRAGYGEGVRSYLAKHVNVLQIIDFGHAPIFPNVDVFPCITITKKSTSGREQNMNTLVCQFPRSELKENQLSKYIHNNNYSIPASRFSGKSWNLEPEEIMNVIKKISSSGTTLKNYVSALALSGIKTGLNEAYLVDQETYNLLVERDSRSAEVLEPYLRGRDISRWIPKYQNLWIILLKSSLNKDWPWANATSEIVAENIFANTYPAIYLHMKKHEDKLRHRSDKGNYWWELRSSAYYSVFENSQIMWQDLAYHSRFCFVESGFVPEMTCFTLPCSDTWVLACLNSPLIWSWLWRNTIHGKDEVLRLKTVYTQNIPIAEPTDSQKEEADILVKKIILLEQKKREKESQILDWIQLEFKVIKLGRRLENFAGISEKLFLQEIRNRSELGKKIFSPSELDILRKTYQEYKQQVLFINSELKKLEQHLSNLVNQAYGLTQEETTWLWRSAPPRMPIQANVLGD